MYSESIVLQIEKHQISQSNEQYVLELAVGGGPLVLTSLEYQYFQQMSLNLSLEQVVGYFLNQGWLVSFRILYELIEKLVKAGFIKQKEIVELVNPLVLNQKNLKQSILGVAHTRQVRLSSTVVDEIKYFPFFRELPEELVLILLKDSRLYSVPRGVALVQKGDTDRDLFVIKSGQAVVAQKNKILAVLPEFSVFGEGAFLLGKPRSADVISMAPTEVVRIKYSQEIENHLRAEKAEKLQKRFWALHGLLNSQMFNSLPIETFDRFLMLGKIKIIPPQFVLIQEGAPGRHFYILIRGDIQISQRGVILRKLAAGSVLGEVALMVSQGVRTASAVTLSECHLIEIEQQEFYQNLAQNLILAKELEEIAFLRWQNQ